MLETFKGGKSNGHFWTHPENDGIKASVEPNMTFVANNVSQSTDKSAGTSKLRTEN